MKSFDFIELFFEVILFWNFVWKI